MSPQISIHSTTLKTSLNNKASVFRSHYLQIESDGLPPGREVDPESWQGHIERSSVFNEGVADF